MRKILIFPIQIISDLFFILLLPVFIIIAWLRFIIKKVFNLKPKVLFSPLSRSMVFLTAQSLRAEGFNVDVIAYDHDYTFDGQRLGFCVKDHPILNSFLYLTDYIWIFAWSLLNYDLYEFPFYGGLLHYSRARKLELWFLKVCAKKVIVFAYGSDSYLPSKIRQFGKYNAVMDTTEADFARPEKYAADNIKRAQKYGDVLIAGADIIYLGKKAIMLPIAADLSKWPFVPLEKKKIVTLLFSSNHAVFKGARFIYKAYEDLKKEGYPVELLSIGGKTVEECYELYKQGDIFVPDVITGWYGSTQIEAMSLGKVVVSYQKDIFKPYHDYYAKNCPIVSADPDNLKEVLAKLINNFELRQEIGKLGSEYVQKYHSFEFIGKLRGLIYTEVWQNRKLDQKSFERLVQINMIIR